MRFDNKIRSYDFIYNEDKPFIYKKTTEPHHSCGLICDDIVLIGN